MPDTAKSPANLKSIQGSYAQSADDIYRNKPFHGTVHRVLNGQKTYFCYISQDKRLQLSDFLQNNNITDGIFILDTEDENGNPLNIEFQVDKNGEPKTRSHPFLSNYNGESPQKTENSGMSSALKEEYETQILKLRGQVSELTDDLVKARRQLGDDNTATMIAHKDEIRALEKTHEKRERELEKEISDLKLEIKMKEMQYLHSDRTGWDRFFDMIENHGSEFFANILGQLQQANPGQPVTAEQLHAAAVHEMKQNPPQKPAETASSPENEGATPEETENAEPIPLNQATPEQIEEVKKQIANQLRTAALNALLDENANLQAYAGYIRDQVAILNQQGIPLDAKTWVQMAKVLAERAIEEKVTPERVAKVIKPVLEGVKNYAWMLQMMDPQSATEQLFNHFNVEANEQVKSLVAKVLAALKQSI